jgi:hypothetical protein
LDAEKEAARNYRDFIEKNSLNLDKLKKDSQDYQADSVRGMLENEESKLHFIQLKIENIKKMQRKYHFSALMTFIPPLPFPCLPSWGLFDDQLIDDVSSTFFPVMNSSVPQNQASIATGRKTEEKKMQLSKEIKNITKKFNLIAVPMLGTAIGRNAFFIYVKEKIIDKVLVELKDEEQKTKDNISKINKVILDLSSEGGQLAQGASSQLEKKKYELITLPKLPPVKKCYGINNERSSQACSDPLKLVKYELDPSFDLPEFHLAVNSAQDYIQSKINGDEQKANILLDTGVNNALRARSLHDQMMKKKNEKLILEGKKSQDFEAETKQLANKLSDELGTLSSSSDLKMLATGEAKISPINKEGSSSLSEKKSEKSPVSEIPSDLSLSDSASSEDHMNDTSSFASSESALSNLSSTQGEIQSDPEASLFKQVTNRYFLNYDKLFKRKEITEASTPQDSSRK